MQRIEKLTIENLQILHDAKCRQFHFCQDKFNISHGAKYRSFDSRRSERRQLYILHDAKCAFFYISPSQ